MNDKRIIERQLKRLRGEGGMQAFQIQTAIYAICDLDCTRRCGRQQLASCYDRYGCTWSEAVDLLQLLLERCG